MARHTTTLKIHPNACRINKISVVCGRSTKIISRGVNSSLNPHSTMDQLLQRPDLVEEAISWACQHGLIYGAGLSDPMSSAVVHAPFSLLPTAYPRDAFEKGVAAAPLFNTLMDAIASDTTYLQEVLATAALYDDFTASLLQILEETTPERDSFKTAGRNADLAITRSDYMLHTPTNSLLQVEINTIASSFGCLSTLTSRLHKHLLEWAGADPAVLECLPHNDAMETIADGMGVAIKTYMTHSKKHSAAVMVMVVQPGEQNAYDQRWLSLTLWQRHGIKTLRLSLHDIAQRGVLDTNSNQLTIGGNIVGLVYFRAGYTPTDYPSTTEWDGRRLVEKSDAFKCPSVPWQLAGAKKVQQDLTRPGVVEKWIKNPEDAAFLRSFFAGQWGFDDDDTDADNSSYSQEEMELRRLSIESTKAAVQDAIVRPEGYVLKPQREGGGNNLYSQALKEKLSNPKTYNSSLGAYVLMERILPPARKAVLVRNGATMETETLSEVGVYGVMVRRGGKVLMNREAGHLVRTKTATSDEGGVAAGFAVLDSPLLV